MIYFFDSTDRCCVALWTMFFYANFSEIILPEEKKFLRIFNLSFESGRTSMLENAFLFNSYSPWLKCSEPLKFFVEIPIMATFVRSLFMSYSPSNLTWCWFRLFIDKTLEDRRRPFTESLFFILDTRLETTLAWLLLYLFYNCSMLLIGMI